MSDPLILHSGYMGSAYDDPADTAQNAREAIADANADTLVGTGLSGAVVVPTLARLLGLNWLVVRKDGDGSHSGYPAEGALGARWLFVDDFIHTGATLRRVHRKLAQIGARHGHETEFVGSYEYQYASFDAADSDRVRRFLEAKDRD